MLSTPPLQATVTSRGILSFTVISIDSLYLNWARLCLPLKYQDHLLCKKEWWARWDLNPHFQNQLPLPRYERGATTGPYDLTISAICFFYFFLTSAAASCCSGSGGSGFRPGASWYIPLPTAFTSHHSTNFLNSSRTKSGLCLPISLTTYDRYPCLSITSSLIRSLV